MIEEDDILMEEFRNILEKAESSINKYTMVRNEAKRKTMLFKNAMRPDNLYVETHNAILEELREMNYIKEIISEFTIHRLCKMPNRFQTYFVRYKEFYDVVLISVNKELVVHSHLLEAMEGSYLKSIMAVFSVQSKLKECNYMEKQVYISAIELNSLRDTLFKEI